MDISFAWTTPAVIAHEKTRTRRGWNDDYAARFKIGSYHNALDRQRRFGGKVVEHIVIKGLFKQCTGLLTEQDYDLEGFAYMEAIGKLMQGKTPMRTWFRAWRKADENLWVVDFAYV